MRFTSEDLMKAMGLQVGDRVKTPNNITYLILKTNSGHIWVYDEIHNEKFLINYLVDTEFEILPRPKRVGDTLGDDYEDCFNCPLRLLNYCGHYCDGNLSLYTVLEQTIEYVKRHGLFDQEFDQEIYDLLKARLDKEVSE